MAAVSDHWNPQRYSASGRFVSILGTPVVELLAPMAGERILDLGCGDGVLTKELMNRGCDVVGIDASPAMVQSAQENGVHAKIMRADCLDFAEEFDAVFSNAALHWMERGAAVMQCVWNALRPNGRFVAECGGQGNIAVICDGLERALATRSLRFADVSPWSFRGVDEYRALLEESGFLVRSIESFSRPTDLPGSLADWVATFGRSFLEAVAPEDRRGFLADVTHHCRPVLQLTDGRWTADYVRIRFDARKPI